MGHAFAVDLTSSDLDLRRAVGIHLTSNHYPPVPAEMIEPCVLAIEASNDGDDELLIELPEGVLWRNEPSAPAWAIVEGHHLESWLTANGEDW